ncbi:Rrf2 family transcriptional regulator [Sphingobium sp. PNB]|uniref:RrF2 family transcriptional regulator n=1 Tax=Sphingobium sp. PNB TaxID=863934 RepID=UPI001CA3D170|nr:Rrf2 family transcriptional regulator [Sphingobium sp. PNB]MCB4860372.1 Rrf2 family transcriptional regulator [Sphingobium sp. PNB]
MRLTRYTDYALRMLLYLAERPERVCAIAEIATAHAISKNHLMKVVHELGKAGYVQSVRGCHGGMRLCRPPDAINIGAVVREMEGDFDLVDCASCVITHRCGLQGALGEALGAFLAVLDDYSLADLSRQAPASLTNAQITSPMLGSVQRPFATS